MTSLDCRLEGGPGDQHVIRTKNGDTFSGYFRVSLFAKTETHKHVTFSKCVTFYVIHICLVDVIMRCITALCDNVKDAYSLVRSHNPVKKLHLCDL